MLRAAALLGLCAPATAHFVFVAADADTGVVNVTFADGAPSAPSAAFLVTPLLNVTTVSAGVAGKMHPVPLRPEVIPGAVMTPPPCGIPNMPPCMELAGMLPCKAPGGSCEAPYVVAVDCPYGVFSEGGAPPALLHFYASAPIVNADKDWDAIETALAGLSLQVELRPVPTTTDAQVVALWKGAPVAGNVTVLNATGAEVAAVAVNTTAAAFATLPGPGTYWAKLNYRVMTPGKVGNQTYDFEDHWATSSLVIA